MNNVETFSWWWSLMRVEISTVLFTGKVNSAWNSKHSLELHSHKASWNLLFRFHFSCEINQFSSFGVFMFPLSYLAVECRLLACVAGSWDITSLKTLDPNNFLGAEQMAFAPMVHESAWKEQETKNRHLPTLRKNLLDIYVTGNVCSGTNKNCFAWGREWNLMLSIRTLILNEC